MGDDFKLSLVSKVQHASKDTIYDIILKGYTMLHIACGKKPDAMMLDGMSELSTNFICEKFKTFDVLEVENIFKKAVNGELGEFKFISHVDFVKWAWSYNNIHRKITTNDPEKDKDEHQIHNIYKRQKERRMQVIEDRFWDSQMDDDPNDKLLFNYQEARHLGIVSDFFEKINDKFKGAGELF